MPYDVKLDFDTIAWDVDPATLTLHELQGLGTSVLMLNDEFRRRKAGTDLPMGCALLEDRPNVDLVLGIIDEIGELREALKHEDRANIAEEMTDIFFRTIRLLTTKRMLLMNVLSEMRTSEMNPTLGSLFASQSAVNARSQSTAPLSARGVLHAYGILIDLHGALAQEESGERLMASSALRGFLWWYFECLQSLNLTLITVTKIFLAKQHMIAEGDLAWRERDREREYWLISGVLGLTE